MNGFALLLITFLSFNTLYAAEVKDEVESNLVEGIKYSDDKTESVWTKALLPSDESFKGGFNDLIEFVVAAPYQDDAGSCLFMSHTGATEVLVNQKRKSNIDLSERYFMNLQKAEIGDDLIKNWRTDTIYRLNKTAKTYLNKDFHFTKGWYKLKNGTRIPAKEEEKGASYGTRYNWIVELTSLNNFPAITLPKFSREVIFADPSENQWNVGGAPKDIVNKVKAALKTNKAPVIVIYNHVGFWHANLVVGYNDNASSEGCPFVANYNDNMNNRADEIIQEANQATDESSKRKLLKKAANFRKRGQSVHDAYLANGGCQEKGVFYVRDSIYPDKAQPLYDYDLNRNGEEEHLNAKIILREYSWLERLSNHAVQIRAN